MQSILHVLVANGLAISAGVQIEKLHIIRRNNGIVRIQGVLISYEKMDEVLIFPEGTFTCGCCSMKNPLTEKTWARFSARTMKTYCQDCIRTTHILTDELSDLTYMGPYDPAYMADWKVEDIREKEGVFDTEWTSMLKRFASKPYSEFIYYDNLTIEDIRARFLAKRVIAQLRRNVIRRWRRRTSLLLRLCCQVGRDMAEYWTQTCMKT